MNILEPEDWSVRRSVRSSIRVWEWTDALPIGVMILFGILTVTSVAALGFVSAAVFTGLTLAAAVWLATLHAIRRQRQTGSKPRDYRV